MKYKDKNCDTLVNLALIDPPRWGWSANGGIVDVLTPHERARRTVGKREYLARQDTVKRRASPVKVSKLAGLGSSGEKSTQQPSAPVSASLSTLDKMKKDSNEVKTMMIQGDKKHDDALKVGEKDAASASDTNTINNTNTNSLHAFSKDEKVLEKKTTGAVVSKNGVSAVSPTSPSEKKDESSLLPPSSSSLPPKDGQSKNIKGGEGESSSSSSMKETVAVSIATTAINTNSLPLSSTGKDMGTDTDTDVVMEEARTVADSTAISLTQQQQQQHVKEKIKVEAKDQPSSPVSNTGMVKENVKMGAGVSKDHHKDSSSSNIQPKTISIPQEESSTNTSTMQIPKNSPKGKKIIQNQYQYPHPKYDVSAYKVVHTKAKRGKREKFDLEVIAMHENPNYTTSGACSKDKPNLNVAEGDSASTGVSASVSANINVSASASASVKDQQSSPMEIESSPLSSGCEINNNNNSNTSSRKLLHPDAYHRGLSKQEPRARNRGYLLLDSEKTDTNHDWDINGESGNLQFQVLIEFPLVNIDDMDDVDLIADKGDGQHEDDDHENNNNNSTNQEDSPSKPRRSARRGDENEKHQNRSEMERRIRREAILKTLPHFRDVVVWDLANQKTPTPMVYAADVAAEFGLSFCQTLDLARSIQKQIDTFVKDSGYADYHVPIAVLDPLGIPRGKGTLQPPKYSTPKLLLGGHCAADSTTSSKPFEIRPANKVVYRRSVDSESNERVVAGTVTETAQTSNGKNGTTKKAVTGSKSVVKQFSGGYSCVPQDQLPQHDISSLGLDPIYGQVFARRALDENRKILKKIADGNIGVPRLLENHYCHFCHMKRPLGIQFPCGNEAHCFCDLHTSRRLGYSVHEAIEKKLDHCPICSLQCTCYRCTGRFSDLVCVFAKECTDQKCDPNEVQFNFVWQCNRNLAKLAKRATTEKKTEKVAPKVTRRKSGQNSKHTPPASEKNKIVVVSKVAKIEFPAELSSGINRDPSLKNDYNTIFTPEGSTLCPVSDEDKKQEIIKPKVVVEDGNVDYCDVCKKIGDIICCDKCPRGFHKDCLGDKTTKFPALNWTCHRCVEDANEQKGGVLEGSKVLESVKKAYKPYTDNQGFEEKLIVVCKIYDMIDKLKAYDFGPIFSEPVDCKIVRDYKTYVKRPMDLSTVQQHILKGTYCKYATPKRMKDLPGQDKATVMDVIILSTLKDIEQIWHNCFLYNREGSSFYRMGQVLRLRCNVMRRLNFERELNDFIRQNFGRFIEECKVKRQELSNSLKPWIPTSKYNINIPPRGGAAGKVMAIFDPDTNMVIKQYTSLSSACLVVDFLLKLGNQAEVKVTNKQAVKSYLNSMADDPSLLLFGYRWLSMDDVRNGNFKLCASETIIKRQCQISKAISKEYKSVEDAFKDWKDLQKTSVSIPQTNESERSLQYFRTVIIEKGVIDTDQQKWILITKEASTSKSGNDRNEMTSMKLSHKRTPSTDTFSSNTGQKTGPVLSDQIGDSAIPRLKMIEQTGEGVNHQPVKAEEADTAFDGKVGGVRTTLPKNETNQAATQTNMVVEKVAGDKTVPPKNEASQAATQTEMVVAKVAGAKTAPPKNEASQAVTQTKMVVEKVACVRTILPKNEASQISSHIEMVIDSTIDPTSLLGPKEVCQDEMMFSGSQQAAMGVSSLQTEQQDPPERENIKKEKHLCDDNSADVSESRKRPLEGNAILQVGIKRPAPN